MAETSIYCVVCLKSHAPPVAVAVMDRCPSQPDLMAALEESLRDSHASPRKDNS